MKGLQKLTIQDHGTGNPRKLKSHIFKGIKNAIKIFK